MNNIDKVLNILNQAQDNKDVRLALLAIEMLMLEKERLMIEKEELMIEKEELMIEKEILQIKVKKLTKNNLMLRELYIDEAKKNDSDYIIIGGVPINHPDSNDCLRDCIRC